MDDVNRTNPDSAREPSDQRRGVCEEVEEYVAAEPWRSLGIALAIGFVIGRFIL
jgi:ElaB/YqjD/DUF883 family membrane-anchored ribosome-binding protein